MNPLDLQTRRGDYRDQVALPAVIGKDVSGVVVETGTGAGDFQPGDEVWCLARAGERVLVHGGAGGVGSVAVQVASALGAEVVTTARARDHEFVTGLGADTAIDFSAGDYVPRIRALGGVDVVLDTVGGDTSLAAQRSSPTEAGWCPLWTRPSRRTCSPRGA